MDEHVYKKIEITGSSRSSIEDAVENAIVSAAKTVHNMRWFEVVETRGYIRKTTKVAYWQVTIKVGFNCLKVKDLNFENTDSAENVTI